MDTQKKTQTPTPTSDAKQTWSMFLDFDSFFAHVEKSLDPDLANRPVAVCPTLSAQSGVIACCYLSKSMGVKRGMRREEAEALAPHIVFRHARHDVYIDIHHKIIAAIEKHVPVEKAWSVDEMSIDLKRMDVSKAVALAKAIKDEFRAAFGPIVTASIGIAKTGLLAKIGAEMNKPDGLVVLHPDTMPEQIHTVPLGDIPGVAKGMLRRLRAAGVTSTPQLLALEPKQARKIWGSVDGERLWRGLHGERTEKPETKRGMFGHSRVLARHWRHRDKAGECVRILCTHAARRLRADGYFATRMSVGAKTAAQERIGLNREFPAVRDDFALQKIAAETYAAMLGQTRQMHLTQVSIVLHGIVHEDDIVGDLFTGVRSDPKQDKAVRAMDALNAKFEKNILKIGAPEDLPGGYDGVKIAFGRIPDAADIRAAGRPR